MTNLAQWAALVGFVTPLLVAVVQQSHWGRPVRTVIGILSVLAASVVTAAVEGHLTLHSWATSLIWVATAAYTSYTHIWVPLGAAPAIEQATTVSKSPA